MSVILVYFMSGSASISKQQAHSYKTSTPSVNTPPTITQTNMKTVIRLQEILLAFQSKNLVHMYEHAL